MNRLDHVNLRTGNLDAMIDWYCDVLGMTNGWRPPFQFPGAWLYAGDDPVVHLVGVNDAPANTEPTIEHFALSATGLAEFLARLDSAGIPYRPARVPGAGILQINVHDVDGNHIHIDFSHEEADAAGF
jgi:catechol 2,3-dioxygenase-like lactoylglutathione lyase family enzyme